MEQNRTAASFDMTMSSQGPLQQRQQDSAQSCQDTVRNRTDSSTDHSAPRLFSFNTGSRPAHQRDNCLSGVRRLVGRGPSRRSYLPSSGTHQQPWSSPRSESVPNLSLPTQPESTKGVSHEPIGDDPHAIHQDRHPFSAVVSSLPDLSASGIPACNDYNGQISQSIEEISLPVDGAQARDMDSGLPSNSNATSVDSPGSNRFE